MCRIPEASRADELGSLNGEVQRYPPRVGYSASSRMIVLINSDELAAWQTIGELESWKVRKWEPPGPRACHFSFALGVSPKTLSNLFRKIWCGVITKTRRRILFDIR